MPIDIPTIKNIAHLARLELTSEEESQLSVDIEQILNWINQLEEVNTEGIDAVIHMHGNVNVFRNDEASNDLTRTEALANAPVKEGEYFKVVKVV